MNNKGSITIFAALILVSIMMLMCALIESSRIISSKSVCEEITDVSCQSAFSKYVKEVFEEYGIFCLNESKRQFMNDMKYYINETLRNSKDIYGAHVKDCSINNVYYITDNNGDFFSEQVENLMKYKMSEDVINVILNRISGTDVGDKIKKALDKVEKCEEYLANVEDSVRMVKEYTGAVKKNITEMQNCIDDYNTYVGKIIRANKKSEKREEYINCLLEKKYNLENYVTEIENYLSKVKDTQEMYNDEKESVDISINNANKELEDEGEYKNLLGEMKSDLQQISENLSKNDYYKMDYVGDQNEKLSLYLTDLKNKIAILDEAAEHDEFDRKLLLDKYESNLDDYDINISDEPVNNDNSIINNAKKLLSGNWLKLVVDDISEISDKEIDTGNLPSIVCEYSNNYKYKSQNTVFRDVMYSQYLLDYCTSYVSDKTAKKDKEPALEIEYIISGKDSDISNMKSIVKQIVAIREGFNLAHIFTDSQKKLEAAAMAEGLVGMTGIAPLVSVTKYGIILLWATAESITDVRNMLEGGRVPLAKTKNNWNTSLANIASRSEYKKYKKNRIGLTYEDYLRILLIKQNKVKQVYRTLDIIQINIANKYDEDFEISGCIEGAEVKAKFSVGKLFNLGTRWNTVYHTAVIAKFKY